MIDEILAKYNLKYEDLNPVEKETLNTWIEVLQKGELSLDKIKQYIVDMKEAVAMELSKHNLRNKKDLYLKARLRNYILLDAFLTTPEKAKEKIEEALSGIAGGK
jgi:hypothetical protein